MREFIITLLTCSVTVSVVALFYMAFTPMLAKRYSARGRYYAWLIIVIGLIIPFRPQWDNAIIKVSVPVTTTAEAPPIIRNGNSNPVILTETNTAADRLASSISLWQIITLVWFAGMFITIAYHVIRHYRFTKTARRWSENITDEQTLIVFQSLKTEMGISRHIGLYLCSTVGSPMLVGIITPRILLPLKDLSKDELRFILKHELVHYKRKDLYYKCTVLLATCIHWFNPIVYMIVKAIDIGCEISCDDEIIRSTGVETRRHYSETIIGAVRYQSKLKTALSTNFYGGKNSMSKRIFSIMDTGKKKAGAIIICVTLMATLGTGAAFASNSSANNSGTTAVSASSSNTAPYLEGSTASRHLSSPITIFEPVIKELDGEKYMEITVSNTGPDPVTDFGAARLLLDGSGLPTEDGFGTFSINVYDYLETQRILNLTAAEKNYKTLEEDILHSTEYGMEEDVSQLQTALPEAGIEKERYTDKSTSQLLPGNKLILTLHISNTSQGAETLLTLITEATFTDGSVWTNPEYKDWATGLDVKYYLFGISYNEDGKMLFDGKTVRYFWDGFYVDYPSYATIYDYLNEEGVIDVHTVRSVIDNGDGSYNPHGELLDIVAYSQQEFDARDIDWIKRGSTAAQSSDEVVTQEEGGTGIGSVSAQSGLENGSVGNGRTIAEIMKDYEIYGIEYERRADGSDNMGNMYYNGQPVKTFVDVKNDGGVSTFSSVDGGDISVRTVYDINDKLTGVEITNGGNTIASATSVDSSAN